MSAPIAAPSAADITAVAREFLAWVRSDSAPGTCEGELARLLDALAWCSRGDRGEVPDDEGVPASSEYDEMRARISARLPNIGMYRAPALLEEDGSDPLLIGDAIDDVVDLARAMERVVWCAEHHGLEAAAEEFHIGYETAWCDDLRCLQWYLCELRVDRT